MLSNFYIPAPTKSGCTSIYGHRVRSGKLFSIDTIRLPGTCLKPRLRVRILIDK